SANVPSTLRDETTSNGFDPLRKVRVCPSANVRYSVPIGTALAGAARTAQTAERATHKQRAGIRLNIKATPERHRSNGYSDFGSKNHARHGRCRIRNDVARRAMPLFQRPVRK